MYAGVAHEVPLPAAVVSPPVSLPKVAEVPPPQVDSSGSVFVFISRLC
jgi:hypothetical protein